MAKDKTPTIGGEQEALLFKAIEQFTNAPLEGARDLPELTGLHAPPKQIYNEPQDNVILKAIRFLKDSTSVFSHGDSIVYQSLGYDGQRLSFLRTGNKVETAAESILANQFTCRDGPHRFPPPRWFVTVTLKSDLLFDGLPRILTYAKRPVFDTDFNLCTPGWNAGSGILVHGSDVEPVMSEDCDPDAPAKERLPPHIQNLLSGFCFKSDADLVNALGMLLTGLLANHFVTDPKGLFLVDGNQPGLGKSWLVRVVGIVLDNIDPQPIAFTDDEELGKRIGATLRERWQSIIFIDNAKTLNGSVIHSPMIESMSVAPLACFRILGKSENFSRPNDLLWALTMNDTRVSPDLVSRGVPIQLAYEGKPEERTFIGPTPLDYAREHRLVILGELIGMVIKWNHAGRPIGDRSHRSSGWAAKIGGVLKAAGFPEFLANAEEAAAAFNSQLEELAALAEAVVTGNGPFVETSNQEEECE